MNVTTLVILAILAVLVIATIVYFLVQRWRSVTLRKQFGPEYTRVVNKYGDQGKAEAELAAREKRLRKVQIRVLTPEEQSRFMEAWKRTQERFVDEPSRVVSDAHGLVKEVMETRGYPMADFEQRAADVSVDHPYVVSDYHAAHEIADRNKSGRATTEDLRQAMVHYRFLFQELLETAQPAKQKEVVHEH